jgi:hypothetical protein
MTYRLGQDLLVHSHLKLYSQRPIRVLARASSTGLEVPGASARVPGTAVCHIAMPLAGARTVE